MASAARAAGHPLHPPFVHLPLGLLLTLPGWDALAWRAAGGPWWTIAFWDGAAGVACALLAIVTGLIDLRGVPPRAVPLAVGHLALMGTAVLAAAVSLASLHGYAALPGAAHPLAALAVDAATDALLIGGGWLGGHLVYRHRVGVRRPPAEARPGDVP